MAAPGVGKTTLCQQIAETIAMDQKSVIYLNLEMSREQMLAKAISSRLARKGKFYSSLQILQGYSWTDTQRADIMEEINIYNRDIFPYLKYNPDSIDSDLERILDYLRYEGERAKSARITAPVIVLDYLHLISSKTNLDIQGLIKQAVIGLKRYAVDYNHICYRYCGNKQEQ